MNNENEPPFTTSKVYSNYLRSNVRQDTLISKVLLSYLNTSERNDNLGDNVSGLKTERDVLNEVNAIQYESNVNSSVDVESLKMNIYNNFQATYLEDIKASSITPFSSDNTNKQSRLNHFSVLKTNYADTSEKNQLCNPGMVKSNEYSSEIINQRNDCFPINQSNEKLLDISNDKIVFNTSTISNKIEYKTSVNDWTKIIGSKLHKFDKNTTDTRKNEKSISKPFDIWNDSINLTSFYENTSKNEFDKSEQKGKKFNRLFDDETTFAIDNTSSCMTERQNMMKYLTSDFFVMNDFIPLKVKILDEASVTHEQDAHESGTVGDSFHCFDEFISPLSVDSGNSNAASFSFHNDNSPYRDIYNVSSFNTVTLDDSIGLPCSTIYVLQNLQLFIDEDFCEKNNEIWQNSYNNTFDDCNNQTRSEPTNKVEVVTNGNESSVAICPDYMLRSKKHDAAVNTYDLLF